MAAVSYSRGVGEVVGAQRYELVDLISGVKRDSIEVQKTRGDQAGSVDFSKRYVVWQVDTEPDLGVEDWILYAYDRKSKETRELIRAPRVHGLQPPPPPGYTGPQLSGDRVYWAQVSGRIQAEKVDVYGCDISDCKPEKVVEEAAFPTTSEGSLYAFKSDRYAGDRKAADNATAVRVDLSTGKQSTVVPRQTGEKGEVFTSGAAGPTGAVMVFSSRTHDTARIYRDGRLVDTVRSLRQGAFGYPVVGDGFVAWAESSGTGRLQVGGYLYDIDDQALFSLGNQSGLYGVEADGDTIYWQEGDAKGINLNAGVTDVVARYTG